MTALGDDERSARMMLSRVCEPGDVDASRLVRDHGALALLERLQSRSGASGKLEAWAMRMAATSIGSLTAAADAVDARYLCPGDREWPFHLDDLARLESASGERRGGGPFGLWVRGSADLTQVSSSVSIVGARASSAYGDHVAGDLAYHCGARGWITISGGAYGIDAAAHRGALAGDHVTIAVLAGGIDRLYPAGNSNLLRSIARDGLLVAEAAPGCTPTKSRFLVRNRLIAALGCGTVVVEAALRSGALSTARWGLDLGRPVMGVPGPVTSSVSRGVHELLRQPDVMLVTDVDEVLEHVSAIGSNLAPHKAGPTRPTDQLGETVHRVLEAMPRFTALGVEQISVAAGVGPDDVAKRLDELAELGLVVADGDSWRLREDHD